MPMCQQFLRDCFNMQTFLGLTSGKIALLVYFLLIIEICHCKELDNPEGKIYNGQEALLDKTKFQVSIRKKENDLFFGSGVLCGGTLVSENVVISAAHCFVDYEDPLSRGYFLNKTDFSVAMGTLNRFKKTNNTLQFEIKELILGVEKFNLKTYNFDIAILILDGSVPENHPTISPIPINLGNVDNGTMCQISGWGTTEEGVTSSILMSLEVPVLNAHFCAMNSNYKAGSILPGMFCAGYVFTGYFDACFGDSGGPLACSETLTGIVSWGFNCALPRYPGVYTEVGYYYPWIESQLSPYNITLKTANMSTTSYAPITLQLSSLLLMLNFLFIFQELV